MSKNYYVVQYVWPPGFMPNLDVEEVTLAKFDEYIKAGKAAMNGAYWAPKDQWDPNTKIEFNKGGFHDYRRAACPRSREAYDGGMASKVELVLYRIFIDQAAALEYAEFMLNTGAISAKIVTEEDKLTGVVGENLPFPSESVVGQLIWPGHPGFEYNGTYPEPGPADAEPIPLFTF